jgi:hypothetical protein
VAVITRASLVFLLFCHGVSVHAQDLSLFHALCQGDRTPGIAVGDVNGDGQPDVVFANGRHVPQPNLLYIGARGGREPFFPPRALGNAASYSVAFADLDRDGDLDLVEGNDFGFHNVVWINDGRGNFSSEFFFGPSDRTRELAVGDVTGDGFPDIVVANFVVAAGDSSRIYFNDGRARFPRTRGLPVGDADAAAVAVADIDSDGALDIVLGTLRGHPNYVLLNGGGGQFQRAIPFGTDTADTESIVIVDLDGDGKLDIVAGNTGQQDHVYFGDGTGRFPRSRPFGAPTSRTRAIAVGDMDADGTLDVVVGYESVDFVMIDEVRGAFRMRDDVNRVFLNDGRGMLRPGPTFGAPGAPTRAIALADINGDGRLDVIVGNDCTQNQVFLNGAVLQRPSRQENP